MESISILRTFVQYVLNRNDSGGQILDLDDSIFSRYVAAWPVSCVQSTNRVLSCAGFLDCVITFLLHRVPRPN